MSIPRESLFQHPASAEIATTVCHSEPRGDKVHVSGDHESKYQVEVIGLGRQDWFSEP